MSDYIYELSTNDNEPMFQNEEMVKRSKKHRYYPSNNPQTFVRNAVTGVKYPFLVGSNEQRQLYKMVDALGTCDSEGFIIKDRNNLPNLSPNHLFYDSPEQCMSHLNVVIPFEDIKRWREKTQKL
jgi:hypothetical protein